MQIKTECIYCAPACYAILLLQNKNVCSKFWTEKGERASFKTPAGNVKLKQWKDVKKTGNDNNRCHWGNCLNVNWFFKSWFLFIGSTSSTTNLREEKVRLAVSVSAVWVKPEDETMWWKNASHLLHKKSLSCPRGCLFILLLEDNVVCLFPFFFNLKNW